MFPLCIRGGKDTPFLPYISALIFCLFNGFMQAHYLLNFKRYDEEWASSLNFVIGNLDVKALCSYLM